MKSKHKSIDVDTKLCKLGKLSIISGKNGTGKSQLLKAIKEGYIEAHIDSYNGLLKVINKDIVFESTWSIKQKSARNDNLPQVDNLLNAIEANYKSHGSKWNFQFMLPHPYNRLIEGRNILKEIYGDDEDISVAFDKDTIKEWLEKYLLKTQPFQLDMLADMMRRNWVRIGSKKLEQERFDLSKVSVWNKLNNFLKETTGLDICALEPSENDILYHQHYIPKFSNSSGAEFEATHISDGERVLLTIALSVLAAEESNLIIPKVLLLDEVDATLHPSMIQNLLDLLRNAFVEKNNMHVILTTHSPTTVALANDDELYIMTYDNNERLKKSTRDRVLKDLAFGIPTLSVTYRNRRNAIVESENDAVWLGKLYNAALSKGLISSEISLNFIASGMNKSDNSGNSDRIKKIVRSFDESEKVTGLIDRDSRKTLDAPGGIYILTGLERYSLENLLLDPLWIVEYFKANFDLNIFYNKKYGFADCNGDTQCEIDLFFEKVAKVISSPVSSDIVCVRYSDGKDYKIPSWYLNYNGHDLKTVIMMAFSELGKFKKNDALFIQIASFIEKQRSEKYPDSLIKTFNALLACSKI